MHSYHTQINIHLIILGAPLKIGQAIRDVTLTRRKPHHQGNNDAPHHDVPQRNHQHVVQDTSLTHNERVLSLSLTSLHCRSINVR